MVTVSENPCGPSSQQNLSKAAMLEGVDQWFGLAGVASRAIRLWTFWLSETAVDSGERESRSDLWALDNVDIIFL